VSRVTFAVDVEPEKEEVFSDVGYYRVSTDFSCFLLLGMLLVHFHAAQSSDSFVFCAAHYRAQ